MATTDSLQPLHSEPNQCVLRAALVISCHSHDEAIPERKRASEEEEEKGVNEAKRVAEAFSQSTGLQPAIKFQPNRNEFYTSIEGFVEEMVDQSKKGAKDFLFYYTGDGCELGDGEFRFIPIGAERPQDYIPLPEIIAMIEGAEIRGCQIVFAIDACRNNLEKEHAAHIIHKYPPKNEYPMYFSTGPADTAAHDRSEKESPFARRIAESIPKMTCRNSIHAVIAEAISMIRNTEEQEEPAVHGARHLSSNSSVNSASGSRSSIGGLVSSVMRWGYSIFDKDLSGKFPDFVEDIRQTHRRRVNRHTAPVVKPSFVILGNTESATAMVDDFRKSGMGPHYLILKDGRLRRLVDEEHMAWCYNFAYWKSEDIAEPEEIPGGERPNTILKKGVLNELKSYAVSIFLEGDGGQPYAEKQYTALLDLLTGVKERWADRGGLPPWNVLSAGEVEQPPPASPAPGESFDWSRLVEKGFSLEVKDVDMSSVPKGQEFKDALVSSLREWGYEFGDLGDNTGLENRLRAFRHRYARGQNEQRNDSFEFSEKDFAVVTALLKARSEYKANEGR